MTGADAVEAMMRSEAERRVLAVRGSLDAPGFEACVQAELAAMKKSSA